MQVVSGIECSHGKEFEIETALMEAMANAVRHGAKKDPNKKVECVVACEKPLGMLIIVRDPAKDLIRSRCPTRPRATPSSAITAAGST